MALPPPSNRRPKTASAFRSASGTRTEAEAEHSPASNRFP